MNWSDIYGVFKPKIIYLLIFFIAFGLRLCGIQHKNCVHHDEPFSFLASTPANLSPEGKTFKTNWDIYTLDFGKDYSAKELKKSFFESGKGFNSVVKDLKTIRENNIDSSHPTLFYNILRIWDTGLDGTEPDKCLKRGYFLNLIFFTLSFFFMFKLLSLIKPDDTKFISIGLFFAFCSTAGIANTMLVREYALAEPLFILGAYLFVLLYKAVTENKNLNKKLILGSSFAFALLALTGYFSAIFYGITVILLLFFCFKFKNFNMLKKISLILLLSLIWILIIYPDYFYFMFTNKFNNLIQISLNLLHKFNYFKYIFYKPVLLLIIVFGLFSRHKNYPQNKPLNLLILITLLWNFIIVAITPIYSERFIFPSAALLTLIMTLFVYPLKNIFAGIILGVYLATSVYLTANTNFIPNEHLTNEKEYRLDNITPVIFYLPDKSSQDKYWYYIYYLFTKVKNNQTVRFEKALPSKDFKYNSFYLVTMFPSDEKAIKYIKPYKIHREYTHDFLYTFGHYFIHYVEIK